MIKVKSFIVKYCMKILQYILQLQCHQFLMSMRLALNIVCNVEICKAIGCIVGSPFTLEKMATRLRKLAL